MSVIYSTVCEVLGGRAKTADDRQFLDSAAIIPAVIPLQRYYRRCISVTVVYRTVPYRTSTVHSVPSPRYYREILPIPIVITAVTAVLPHSPLPCHSLPSTSIGSNTLKACYISQGGGQLQGAFIVPPCRMFCEAKNAPNSFSAGAPLRTPLGEFTTLPHSL